MGSIDSASLVSPLEALFTRMDLLFGTIVELPLRRWWLLVMVVVVINSGCWHHGGEYLRRLLMAVVFNGVCWRWLVL